LFLQDTPKRRLKRALLNSPASSKEATERESLFQGGF
jgi:hypothetical protein